MALVSLADLRTQARNRADMRINGIFTDADFDTAINEHIYELNDLLVKCWGDAYFLSSSSIQLQPGVTTYSMPSGTYKLAGIDWQSSQGMPTYTMHSFEFPDRNRYANSTLVIGSHGTNMRYCMTGDSLLFAPTPTAANQVTIWYVPQPVPLVNDTDTYDFVGGWQSFVTIGAAIDALTAEESDTSALERQKAEMKDRIQDMAPKRDQGEPHSVVDVECLDDRWW